jgi:large subunit ribosomal protein L22
MTMLNALTKQMATLALKPSSRPRLLSSLVQRKALGGSNLVNFCIKKNASSLLALSSQQPLLRSFVSTPTLERYTVPDVTAGIPKDLIITDPEGRRFAAVDLLTSSLAKEKKKLKPKVIRRRLEKLKTYTGTEKNIRHSPWRLQLICKHVTGMPLTEALQQLEFLTKVKAPLVYKVLKRTSNLADIRHGIQISQLEVAECFSTHGSHLKRMKFMGRGRTGIMHHRFSHMRVILREIDFPLKIYTAKTLGEKKRWIAQQQTAQAEYEEKKASRDELEALERQAALKQKERTD